MNKNKKGFISMTLVYTFLIIFLFIMLAILKAYTEKDKFLETINEQIDEDIGANVKTKVTIINKILEDNTPINAQDVPIRFFNVANSHFGNGNGLYYIEDTDITDENDDGKSSRMYFFRGTTERNHIVFAGYCWRIIRTNEDGSLRIRFNGPYNNGKCYTTNEAVNNANITIGKVTFVNDINFSVNNEDYLRYTLDDYQSEVRKLLDDWYRENITREITPESGDFFSLRVADEFFCNDLTNVDITDSEGNVHNVKAAQNLVPRRINPNNLNIYDLSNITNTLTFKCPNEYSLDVNGLGHHGLTFPIGVLTAQDVVLAGGYLSSSFDEYEGGKTGMQNESYYLYTGFNYWTMSPYSNANNSDPKMIYVNSRGQLEAESTRSEGTRSFHVIPVLSLKASATIAAGKGTSKDPYIVR